MTRPLAVALLCGVLLAACGDDSSARPAPAGPGEPAVAARVDRFDGARAFADLRYQVETIGPRPTGSPGAAKLRSWARRKLPRVRTITAPGGVRSLEGRIPGRKPAVLVAAHYDTKTGIEGFVGAEDGAGGTAAVLELARVLRRTRRSERAPEIRFVLFDGEECDDDSKPFYSCGLRGSRDYAARYAKQLRAVVVLDFIAQKDLAIPRDESSDPRLWSRLRAAARRVGSGAVFPDRTQPTILDDHTPFLNAGVPAIDLIDFDFPCWHKACDDLSVVSQRSLDLSGEAVLELLRTWR